MYYVYMNLSLSSLIPTHGALRNFQQVETMIRFVLEGGVFDRKTLDCFAAEKGIKPSPLIQITEFEDGDRYIHDGHHRALSIYMGGRKEIYESEYETTRWTYEQYLEVNFGQNWVTPFDPRTEVRIADLKQWKQTVAALRTAIDDEATKKFILGCRDSIVKPRDEIRNIKDIFLIYKISQKT